MVGWFGLMVGVEVDDGGLEFLGVGLIEKDLLAQL